MQLSRGCEDADGDPEAESACRAERSGQERTRVAVGEARTQFGGGHEPGNALEAEIAYVYSSGRNVRPAVELAWREKMPVPMNQAITAAERANEGAGLGARPLGNEGRREFLLVAARDTDSNDRVVELIRT